MIHARQDYNRIQDPAVNDPSLLSEGSTPIAEDEPVFLLRAKDIVAPLIVSLWSLHARNNGADERMCQVALDHVKAMEDWQEKNGFKVPDMP